MSYKSVSLFPAIMATMDGYATSDAEWDSELESDSDSELSHWLDQLNQYSKVGENEDSVFVSFYQLDN